MRSFLVLCGVLTSAIFTTSLPSFDSVEDVENEIGLIDDFGISSDIAAVPNQDKNHVLNGQEDCRAGESFSGQSYGNLRARGRVCKVKKPVKNVQPDNNNPPPKNDNNAEEEAKNTPDQLIPDSEPDDDNTCPPGTKGICSENLVEPIGPNIPLVSFSYPCKFILFAMVRQNILCKRNFIR